MTIEGNEFTKEPSVIERLAYKDTWAGGTDSYLDMLYPRLQLMKRLLSEDGSIYVHSDWHANSYVRLLMDEIFGKNNMVNEIIWHYRRWSNVASTFQKMHDNILLYRKSDKAKFNMLYQDYSHPEWIEDTVRGFVDGKLVRLRDDAGDYIKRDKENIGVPMHDVWTDINFIGPTAQERIGYATQKPKALIERIIKTSSDEGDLIADFFLGSGTTLTASEELGRHWIGCELGKVGIQVTRARLVEMAAKPFLIENIGNYQREMIYLTGGRIWEMQHLILKLYGATPRDKISGLGIRKTDNIDELVYVGYPDRPVTARKAEELALQTQNLDGRGYKRLVILGWDYEYNYSQALESRLNALKDKIKIKIESRDIPPDIYDYLKKAKSDEDIEALSDKVVFYERPYLKLGKPQIKEKPDGKEKISISLDRYVLMDIPVSHLSKKGESDYTTLMKLAKDNFAVLIDYWAVDWDYDGCTFKSQWQAFRGNGRKAKTVPITATETLEKKKDRIIAVRVVDIFGNDAGATLKL